MTNNHYWVFAASLTDVEYTITVVDTQGDTEATYHNPPGRFTLFTDTSAFPAVPTPKDFVAQIRSRTEGAQFHVRAPSLQGARLRHTRRSVAGSATPQGRMRRRPNASVFVRQSAKAGPRAPGLTARTAASPTVPIRPAGRRTVILPKDELPSCADPAVVCLQGGRIAVQAVADAPNLPQPVEGTEVDSTDSTAFFGFFEPGQADLAVKVVDGSAVNGELWVFASSLASPGFSLTVTDLQTGKSTTYPAPSEQEVLQVADRQPFAPDPPAGPWLTTSELPGFQFKIRITGPAGEIATRKEADCIPETLCISGAVPGRSELFLRIVGPKPNGFLQPNVVKFSTSQIEVWIDQLSTGLINYYELDGATPGSSDLTGFFDRYGFGPGPAAPP
jgi:hypothetical protein